MKTKKLYWYAIVKRWTPAAADFPRSRFDQAPKVGHWTVIREIRCISEHTAKTIERGYITRADRAADNNYLFSVTIVRK